MRNLILKKCENCNALVKILVECNCKCDIVCCGEKMKTLVANSFDASVEKHKPKYEIKGNKIIVTINHVMEDDHYIEWISMVTDNEEIVKYLKPNDDAVCEFEYVKGATLYAYCSKHGLWETLL